MEELPTPQQTIFSEVKKHLAREAERQRKNLSIWYAQERANGRTNTVYMSSDIPFSKPEWRANMTEATLDGMIQATEKGLGGAYTLVSVQETSKYYLNLSIDGVTLSDSLRDSATTASRIATNTINEHIKNKTTWKRLTDDLTMKNVSRGDLPKYLTNLKEQALKTGGNSPQMRQLIRNAERNIARLSDKPNLRQLKRAYSGVLDAVEKGDTALLNEKLKVAIEKKALYNNQRIARTELQKASSKAFKRQVIDHPEYKNGNVYVQSVLSSGHNVVDICDFLAEVDRGLGAGITTVEDAPARAYHSNCMCDQIIVVNTDFDRRQYRTGTTVENEYLSTKSDRDRRMIETSMNNTTLMSLTAIPRDQIKKASD